MEVKRATLLARGTPLTLTSSVQKRLKPGLKLAYRTAKWSYAAPAYNWPLKSHGWSRMKGDFCLGVWLVQPSLGRMSLDGKPVQVRPKVMDLLVYLAGSPGVVISKDTLLNEVWRTEAISESALTRTITELRQALGDDPEHPQFLETIPKRGYRLIAPVRPVAPEPVRRPRWVWPGALLAVTAAIALVSLSRRTAADRRLVWTTTPVTSFAGQKHHPALSADGTTVVFAWDGADGSLDLYLKQVHAPAPIRLTNTPEDEYSPAWSPDGRYVAFIRQITQRAAVYIMPATGGSERKIADVHPLRAEDVSLDWSRDGKLLAFADRNTEDGAQAIFIVAADGGSKRRLSRPSRQYLEEAMPRFSPDGRYVAYARGPAFLLRDVFLIATGGGEPRRVTSEASMIRGLAWTPDGRHIVFSSDRAGVVGLWRLSIAGGEPQALLSQGESATFPTVSQRGDRLSYVTWRQDANIWRAVGPASDQYRAPEKFIASTRFDTRPSYSPDGKRIVFASDRSGNSQLWICDSDGTNVTQLTSQSGASPAWSPDGHRVAYDATLARDTDVFVIRVEGGPALRLTTDASTDALPSWSSDGRWIYFSSNRSGRPEIWKLPVGGGSARRVTSHGGVQAFESADGKFVFYDKGRGSTAVWRMPTEGGEETRVLDEVEGGYWALMQNGICFLNRKGSAGPTIEFFDFAAGRRTWSTSVPDEELTPGPVGFAVSPDGRWVLYKRNDHVQNDIMLIENFR